MKLIKWLLAVTVSLILALVIYLTVFFDPNDFKPEIIAAVKQHTGRELAIEQDLSWTFFPALGINLGGIALSNPAGFKPAAMVEIKGAVAEVALMPLLSKEVEIAQLTLDGLTVNLVTRKNGESSLDGLVGESKTRQPAQPKPAAVKLESLNIGGVSISQAQVNLIDEAKGQTQSLNLTRFSLGKFSLDEFASVAYDFDAKLTDMTLHSEGEGKLKLSRDLQQVQVRDFKVANLLQGAGIPKQKLTAELLLDADVALDKQQLLLTLRKLSAGDIQGSGRVGVNYGTKVPQLDVTLAMDELDLDAWLPKSEADADKAATSSPATTEPDLSGLKQLDLKLALTVKAIKLAKVQTQNWAMTLAINKGIVDLKQLTADLYQGKLSAKARLDARQKVASYEFNQQLAGVQVRPLLMDAAEVDLLSGSANFSVKGTGKSLLPENIKANLLANGNFEVTDGSLYGVNIPQMLRDAQAKLKGDMSAQDNAERKTDFSSLGGSFTVAKALVTNPDLAMASPLLRLAGAGTANLISEALDYKLTTSLVGSLKGQGGESQDALAGIDIPLAITGTFEKPEYALDTQALLGGKLKQEAAKAEEKLKDKLKESLLKKLGGK
ncbi:AsmA family protein [Shewanella sp. AS16]|uniref:AsmA family protein n=1 Tax=Shewanella sp. AS16 TaxID=2907625 RepID=UPI001F30E1EC|nr:AsmA family protein [Shewanella sp. AS16]MCE9684669.1 AsmA family protein [Shewanella sp. AS16]